MRRRINPPVVQNEALREHVTRVGFNLSLGKTHVAALVYADLFDEHLSAPRNGPWRWLIPGGRGCQDRGLISTGWTLTAAGHLVLSLLKEAGLYEEYAQQLRTGRMAAAS